MHSDAESFYSVLEHYDGDAGAFEIDYGAVGILMKAYLETDDYNDIVLHPISYPEDGELWELPAEVVIYTELRDVSTMWAPDANGMRGFSIGYIACGMYNDLKVIIEQNASPIGVWVNKKCLNTKS